MILYRIKTHEVSSIVVPAFSLKVLPKNNVEMWCPRREEMKRYKSKFRGAGEARIFRKGI